MQSIFHHTLLLTTAVICLLLSACISSPLPSGTVGALYQWDDLDTPVVTRDGIRRPESGGFFDGDFDFSGLPIEHPELSSPDDYPWLLEACDEELCYSIVLFASDFDQDAYGKLSGDASMSALSTLMANEVRGMPVDQVRPALDALSAELTFDGEADYAAFIALDPRRYQKSREMLLYPALYAEAVDMLRAQPSATVRSLLGKEVETTSDLVVSSDFEFDSSWQLNVDIDLSSRLEADAYLLLCREFESSGDGYIVDYSSCPLKAPLQPGIWQGEVKLTGIVEELIVVIMPLHNPNNPEYALWQREVDGKTLLLR